MNKKDIKEEALRYHLEGKPGKIEISLTKKADTQDDMSLAYSPGVAYPCLEIEKEPMDAYKYTLKGNLVAVISNGTAVLGLGNIGALAGKPVMEGKALLFKRFAGVDSFDIEVDTENVEEFIKTVKNIAPTFGGINLEDIKAPECFEIETRLKEMLDIPVMHDDQHGTAIVTAAALKNAVKLASKELSEVKVVINGAGAAALSCAKMYIAVGVKRENLIMCDSKGVITSKRKDITGGKLEFVVDTELSTLEEVLKGSDVFLGLSKGNLLTESMMLSMRENPIVFALANPTPEIDYNEALRIRPDAIVATGRSDYPNQVNNALCFPYIFRGALDTRATTINEAMKLAAVEALSLLSAEETPKKIKNLYPLEILELSKSYIIPKVMDSRLLTKVSSFVAKAAMDSGVARLKIEDMDNYIESLSRLVK